MDFIIKKINKIIFVSTVTFFLETVLKCLGVYTCLLGGKN